MTDPRFTIHEHHSKRPHVDFRLEEGDIVKSWALPKGMPVMTEKRLAIEVEDHSPGCLDFEGIIPEGYGAGRMEIMDTGTYESIKREENTIVFILNGKIISGRFALIRILNSKKKEWLFIKAK